MTISKTAGTQRRKRVILKMRKNERKMIDQETAKQWNAALQGLIKGKTKTNRQVRF